MCAAAALPYVGTGPAAPGLVCPSIAHQICTPTRVYAKTYTRHIRDVYVYAFSLWSLCIIGRHCAHTRLPGCSL